MEDKFIHLSKYVLLGDISVKDVKLNERNGGTTIKKVLEGSMSLIDGSKVKITGWYNVLNTYNYVELLKQEGKPEAPVILEFHSLDIDSPSPFFLTHLGISSYDAARSVKYYFKTSVKHLKMDEKYMPVRATLQEANAYGALHGLGSFSDEVIENATEDTGFDPVTVIARKRTLAAAGASDEESIEATESQESKFVTPAKSEVKASKKKPN